VTAAKPTNVMTPPVIVTTDPPPALMTPTPIIDAYMAACVRELNLPANLTDAMLYALTGPGKRTRPLLLWHSCAAVLGDENDERQLHASLPGATAIEMIHAFSLVHDDLPGLDNDDLRRGRPTLHKHAGEAMAILAGDALLTSAFQVLCERVRQPSLQARLVHELSIATNGMIAGQVFDTLGGYPSGTGDQAKLEIVHRNKTGMLIRAACRMGALCGLDPRPGAGAQDALGDLTTYGEAIGLMFQIVDDLLDVTQTSAHLGKKTGKDQHAGKLTYPGVLGIERSRAEVARLHEQALHALEGLGASAEPLRRLSTYLSVRTR
jgi:geranylgeranyl diphosphate synthase, type II